MVAVNVKISDDTVASALTGAELVPVVQGLANRRSTVSGFLTAGLPGSFSTLSATGLLNLSGAAAGQISFPATQNASSGANTLDDYEEGTFTPRIDGTSSAGVGTYSVQTGTYTKIGRVVFFTATVTWSAHTGTGNMVIAGLPFTASGNFSCALTPDGLVAVNPLYCRVLSSTSTVQLATAASGAGLAALAIDTAASVYATGHFEV